MPQLCQKKRPENPPYPASSFVKPQLMDQVSWVLVSWDVLQEEGEDRFSSASGVGGEGRQRQINGDKWSWEWDGPEAKDINNAGRHWLQHSAISHLVFNLMFHCQHYCR